MTINLPGILKQVQKEDKSSVFYILQMLDHKTWFYRYEESYPKLHLRECLVGMIEKDNLIMNKCESYKKFYTTQ